MTGCIEGFRVGELGDGLEHSVSEMMTLGGAVTGWSKPRTCRALEFRSLT